VPPPTASVPLCAALSIPRAIPLATRQAGMSEIARHRFGDRHPIRGRPRVPTTPRQSVCSSSTHPRTNQRIGGWIENIPKGLRIPRIMNRDHFGPGRGHFLLRSGIFKAASACDRQGDCPAYSGAF